MALALSPLQKFGEWLPDKGPLNNPGAYIAKDVVPAGDDYSSVELVTEEGTALPSECLGKFGCFDKTGIPFTFAGTASKLYRYNGSGWTDVSRVSGYNTTGENRWRFVQFGNYVVATNYIDVLQVFDLGSSTIFADLGGTPPRCKYLQVVSNFLFAVSTNDGVDGVLNYQVWWSALDNITSWTPNIQTQADKQQTPGYGAVNAVVGSQNSAIMFMSEGIFGLDYVGPGAIFNFRLLEPNRGTMVAGSVVAYSNLVFYLGEDGFNMFDGAASKSIGNEKVDNWFKERVDNNNLFKMQAVINPRRKLVMWAFPSAGGSGICDTILVYNWVVNRWSFIEQPVEAMARVYTQAVLADSLSDFADNLTTLADGASYAGGRAVLGIVSGAHRLGFFNGTNRTGIIETKEIRLNTSGRAFVAAVCPVTDCAGATVEVFSRTSPAGTPISGGVVAVEQSTGDASIEVDDIYHRARITLPGVWKRAQGVQIAWRATGK